MAGEALAQSHTGGKPDKSTRLSGPPCKRANLSRSAMTLWLRVAQTPRRTVPSRSEAAVWFS